MKKISIIAAAIALCSCSATKTTDAAVDLNGEWDIVTVDGTAVDTTKTEFRPTLGFETYYPCICGFARKLVQMELWYLDFFSVFHCGAMSTNTNTGPVCTKYIVRNRFAILDD